jgi:hypothetical protein
MVSVSVSSFPATQITATIVSVRGVARPEVRRAWESLVLRPTPTLRFGHATRKFKMNRTGAPRKQIGLEFTGEPHILLAKPVNVRAWSVYPVA